MFEQDEEKRKQIIKQIDDQGDIHKYHYRLFHELPLDAPVSKEQRQSVKGLIFGLFYGRSEKSFSEEIGIPESEGKMLFEKFYHFYPESKQYLKNYVDSAKTNLYFESPLKKLIQIIKL